MPSCSPRRSQPVGICPICGDMIYIYSIPLDSPERGPDAKYQAYCDNDKCLIGTPAKTREQALINLWKLSLGKRAIS